MIAEWAVVGLAVATAAAAGLVGCFAVMRRMALAADALSHVALPGIGLALAFHVNPLAGALLALFAGAVLVWTLEERSGIPVDTIVGVVFSAALAVGSMMTSGEELIEVLFGHAGGVSTWELVFGLAAAALAITFVIRTRHRLVVALVSPDLARTSGVNLRRLNLGYLLVFALTVALGLRHLGVLLMGSLIIIPAATARRLASNLTQMLALSVGVAVVTTVAGLVVADRLHREPGPVTVTMAAGIFALTFLGRRR